MHLTVAQLMIGKLKFFSLLVLCLSFKYNSFILLIYLSHAM